MHFIQSMLSSNDETNGAYHIEMQKPKLGLSWDKTNSTKIKISTKLNPIENFDLDQK